MARPTKYDPAMCERVVELMTDGASLIEVSADLGITYQTLNEWRKDGEKPEFSEAVKRGEELSNAWWERLGRKGASGESDINPTTWIFNMKNRFGWRDKQDVEHSGKVGVEGLLQYVAENATQSKIPSGDD